MKNIYLAVLLLSVFPAIGQTKKVAAMGSSTTAGQGASTPDSSWVRRFNAYYKRELGALDTIYNFGVNGYSFYSGMPDSYTTGPTAVDKQRNVTRSVDLLRGLANPADGVIIVNYPTNNYDTYSINEIMLGLQLIYDSATALGNRCYITTTQPRTEGSFGTSAIKKKLATIKDSILNRFGTLHTLNFWDGMFNPADTTIKAMYSAGDNIHFNNAGHRELFERVKAANIFNLPLPITLSAFNVTTKNDAVHVNWEATCENYGKVHFTVQRSDDNIHFEPLQSVMAKDKSGSQQYTFVDKQPLPGTSFYRLQINEADRSYFSTISAVNYKIKGLTLRRIYPIPAKENIILEIVAADQQNATIEVINSTGIRVDQFMRSIRKNKNIISLPVSRLPPGSYFIRILTKNETLTHSFIK